MRKLFFYSSFFISLLLLIGVYILTLSPRARNGFKNKQNSYKVKPGMNVTEALAIMGYKGEKTSQKESVVYQYVPQQLASGRIAIIVGQDSLVQAVNHGD